jgi:uncharacterized repeat protein (TIGR03847 family)
LSEPTHHLGRVTLLRAEAFGEPGQRTFRIRADSPGGSASLWVEREQLQALSLAIRQVLASRPPGEPEEAEEPPPTTIDENAEPTVEFKVGRLSLGYDESDQSFTLYTHDLEGEPEAPPTATCEATVAQVRALSDEIERIVAAGRPRCFLCGQPIEAGQHVCPRSNGHGQLER